MRPKTFLDLRRRGLGVRLIVAAILAIGPLAAQTIQSSQPQPYEALHALEQSIAQSSDPDLLLQLAREQEAYAERALPTYARLAALDPRGSAVRLAALERGFHLALRDGQLVQAAAFSAELEAAGHPEARSLLGSAPPAADLVVLPGGVSAFAAMAQIAQPVSADRIFAEFAGKVAQQVCWTCQGERLTPAIESYFAGIAALELAGKRNGETVTVALSESTLASLGFKVRREQGAVRLERDKKTAGLPDPLLALGVDEAALCESIKAGKPFPLQIHDEAVPIYPSAAVWKSSFPKLDQRQFALSLLHDYAMARLYLGIATLDRKTLQTITASSGLFFFQGQPGDMLSIYGSAFALSGTHAWVPGGAGAEPVWAALAGVSPATPGPFFQALVLPPKPALLPFFYAIARLDPLHQAWATANVARTRRLYALFSSLPESKPYTGESIPGTSFSAMLHAIPLSAQGRVLFPGALDVWTAGNASASEDDVMLRLLGSRGRANELAGTDFGDFLLVSHIAAHRAAGLDRESALALARNARAYSAFYPRFTTLTAIDGPGFASFFRMADSFGRLPVLEQQLAWGQADALIEWLVLMRRTNAIADEAAARQFRAICDRFTAADNPAARTAASFELARAILAPRGAAPTASWDSTLRAALLGADAQSARGQDFDSVLAEQRAPALDTVFALAALASSPASPPKALQPAQLRFVPIPADPDATRTQRDAYLAYDPAPLARLIDAWNRNAAQPDPRETQRLAAEILKAAEPQMALALEAPLYAAFLRSADPVVARDASLLRKHQFVPLDAAPSRQPKFTSIYILRSLGPFGSYFEGGFAQFEIASGAAASTSWKPSQGGNEVMAENAAAIRATPWDRLSETGQRLVALRILAAREWVVAAARDDAEYASLSDETLHLLSLFRRAELLHGLQARDWPRVWAAFTLPDLFRLGGRFLDRHPASSSSSIVLQQLQAATAAAESQLDFYAAIPTRAYGCDHLHLLPVGPYEDEERQNDPAFVAERAAEFKLFLAARADRLGIAPQALAPVAEPAARKVFEASDMKDYHDWRALLRAYAAATASESSLSP
jgi:hypothetical protein